MELPVLIGEYRRHNATKVAEKVLMSEDGDAGRGIYEYCKEYDKGLSGDELSSFEESVKEQIARCGK